MVWEFGVDHHAADDLVESEPFIQLPIVAGAACPTGGKRHAFDVGDEDPMRIIRKAPLELFELHNRPVR